MKLKHSARVKVYQYVIAAIALIIAFTPSLYAGMSQADLRVVVTALGIDKDKEGKITLSAITIVPQEAEPFAIHHVVTAEGDTISAALQNLSVRTGKLPETGHCEILILSKKSAEAGVDAELKFLFCAGVVSGGATVLVSEGEAAKFLEEEAELNDKAIRINNIIRYARRGAHVVIRTLHEYLSETASVSRCTVLPVTTIKDEEHKGIETAAIFDWEGKLVKVLDKKQTAGVALLDRKTKSGTITVSDFEIDGKNLGNISARLRGKSARVNVEEGEDGLRATITLAVRIRLPERHILASFWNDAASQRHANELLEIKFAEEIKSKINAAADAAKETKKDILGVMQSLHRSDRNLFAANLDSSIEYIVEVSCRLE